jgi:hypothetical protein
MNLARESKNFLVWLCQVVAVFRRADPLHTWTVILATVTARLTNLLAFFLPLKIMLLVGSDGVPRYFRSFVTAETRISWIIGLAIVTVAFYIASVMLEALAKRHAMFGSGLVLREANELVLFSNQDVVAEGHYSRFCGVVASLGFAVLLLGAGLWLYPWLYVWVSGLLIAEFIYAAIALRDSRGLSRSRAGQYIVGKTSNFLTMLSSLNFLLVFGFLLVSFLAYDGVNILIAIIAILIGRQLFTNLSQFVTDAVKLSTSKAHIDALLFKAKQYPHQNRSEDQRFISLFSRPERAERVAELLHTHDTVIESKWVDLRLRGIAAFEIGVLDGSSGPRRTYLERVVSPSVAHLVSNEDLLFRHVDRAQLMCPNVIARYEVEGFVGQLYESDLNQSLDKPAWAVQRRKLLVKFWWCRPPPMLTEAFCASHTLLHDRLTDVLAERLVIAADDAGEQESLRNFVAQLPDIRAGLAKLPLFIFNPKVSREAVIVRADGLPFVPHWTQWSLEPVGVGLDAKIKDRAWLQRNFESVSAEAALPGHIEHHHLVLAAQLWSLERQVSSGRYRAAMRTVQGILQTREECRVLEWASPRVVAH